MSLLEQHFDVAFAAPDGIKKLRELILTLAMQGKLVPQDPNDEPASELLRSIEVEKQRLVKEGKIKQPKSSSDINLDELLYALPKAWEWVRLGEIIVFTNGFAFKSNLFQTNGVGIIKIGDISNGIVNKNRMDFIDERYLKEIDEKFQVNFNDLLIAMSGATTGKLGFNTTEEVFLMNQRVGKIEPIVVDKVYLFNFLSTQIQKNLSISSGSAIPNLSTEQINQTLIPLPPLAEQRRIVAKIDRLMARCDELEKLRIDRSQRLLTVHTAALDRLLTAKDSSEFSTAWSFITQHFGELYSVKENVVELRKTILQLAVMGKLVRQDPNDEPASELLRSIELEKQRLVKEGQIKQPETLPAIKPEEIPAQLPNGWRWGKIDTIVRSLRTDIRTGPFGASLHKADHRTTGIPVWGIESINKNGSFNGKNKIYVDIDKAQELSSFSVQGGDIIISRSGTIGELCQLPEDSPYGLLSTNLMKISLDKQTISPNYFCLLFKGAHSINLQLEELCAGSTRLFLTQSILKKILFPIPPLAEQGRIVEKIDRLMGICDRLEESIESGKGKQTDLLNALMSQV
jgi:type I restriction enzyme, S subunit